MGALACTIKFTGQPGLAQLMTSNIPLVGFAVEDLGKTDKVLKNKAHYSFVPLADVADDVWRLTRASGKATGDLTTTSRTWTSRRSPDRSRARRC